MYEPDVYVYRIKLPDRVNECVTPTSDGGYTVYIDVNLDDDHARAAYQHALKHIMECDFEKTDVQQIEADAHAR